MINLEKAKEEFLKYTNGYNQENERVSLKINHTYGVINASEYIAKKLNLDEENIELAKIIALLHDIGRFEQARVYNNFEDYNTFDHAQIGVDILFNGNFIRKFIKEEKYDSIIYKAILNHNKYKIDENLNEIEELHAKILRDADKLDNFRVKQVQSLKLLCNVEKEDEIGQTIITEKLYNDFINHRTIISSERITPMDFWISYIAFIFDINFIPSFEYIKEKNYITNLVDRIKYINTDTISKMKKIEECAVKYIEDNIKNK